MKYIKFNDKRVDSFLFMELSDLAKTLTRSDETEVEFAVQSYFDPFTKKCISAISGTIVPARIW